MKSKPELSKILFLATIFGGLFCSVCWSQTPADSTAVINLQEIIVKSFEQNKRIKDVPAAINVIGNRTLQRFSSISVLQAINTTPGVRMEERSPGSIRLNIRGSSLRSPFGVRNVKAYYNDLPFTNPGGQTYLNALGFYNFGSIEVIKGPGSSLYGAGTGGVLLIDGMASTEQPGFFAEYTRSSFGGNNVYAGVTTVTEKLTSKSSYQRQQNEGYRSQSNLRRDVLTWTGDFNFNANSHLKTTFVYSDLFYQTPGALNAAEYGKDPTASRPATSAFPSAVAAKAGIYQQTTLVGASYTQMLSSKFKTGTTFYGSFTRLLNPNVQGFERSTLPHFGGRSVFTFSQPLKKTLVVLNAGTEWQQGYTNVSIHKNVGGVADSIRTYDEITNRQSIVFAQASLDWYGWNVMAGASWNVLGLRFQRFVPRPLGEQSSRFENNIVPRMAVLKKWKSLALYSTLSKGFSPPTTEELLPTGGDINLALNAEEGTNYDIGLRTTVNKLSVDVNAFIFSLKNSIVTRRTAGGGSFFVNAGTTSQKGVETAVSHPIFTDNKSVVSGLIWISHTNHQFKYKNFLKDTINYSGRYIPGVAPHTLSAGIDVALVKGLSATIHYFFSGKIPLNDANSVYAKSYGLLGLKLSCQKRVKAINLKVFGGAENLLDEQCSLGNDINGFGGRYFNAAPGRNYFAGFSFQWIKAKEKAEAMQ